MKHSNRTPRPPRPRSMARRVKVGDVLEISTYRGLAYASAEPRGDVRRGAGQVDEALDVGGPLHLILALEEDRDAKAAELGEQQPELEDHVLAFAHEVTHIWQNQNDLPAARSRLDLTAPRDSRRRKPMCSSETS